MNASPEAVKHEDTAMELLPQFSPSRDFALDMDAADIIAPYMTTERTLYLIPGLFEQPEVLSYVSRHVEGARFTARCKLRLVERVDDYELRFRSDSPWGKGQPAWVAEPVSCVARRE